MKRIVRSARSSQSVRLISCAGRAAPSPSIAAAQRASALIEQLQDYCSPLGAERIPVRVVARVKLELEGSDLLGQLAAARLPVSGATFELRCHEIDDDCGTGMPVLMGAWNEVRGVLRVGADGQLVTRAHIMDGLGEYETPISGVVFPSTPDQNTAPKQMI